MKFKYTYILLIVLGISCQEQKTENAREPRQLLASGYLVTFFESGKTGFKNTEGEVVIPARFYHTSGFNGSPIAAVVDEDGWAYINTSGEILFRPFVYDNGPDYFSEGLARFVENGKIGFHNQGGEVIIEPAFDFAMPFSEGRAAVCKGCKKIMQGEHSTMEGGEWGFIDKEGNLVIPYKYDRARSFQKGKAKVRIGKDFFEIDSSGKQLN